MRLSLSLLKSKPLFFRALSALFISGIGTSLTSVAVYQELTARDFGSLGFAIAFAAGMLPGFFTSMISSARAHRWDLGSALWIGQIVGLASLLFPLLSSGESLIFWLLLAECMASAVSGLLLPVYKGLERSSFSEEQFGALAALDTFLLTTNFILGQGLGALLSAQMPLKGFLIVDAITYIFALWCLLPLRRQIPALASESTDSSQPQTLARQQKKALLILPWLALVCAPLMILLPSRAGEWGTNVNLIGWLPMAPVMFLICSRTLGQILGPVMAGRLNMARLAESSWALPGALLVYVALYAFAFHSSTLALVAAAVFAAHVASNVVYTVGNYQMLSAFNAAETVWANGKIYRLMTLITGVSGLAMGWIADNFGSQTIFIFSGLALVCGTVVLVRPSKIGQTNE